MTQPTTGRARGADFSYYQPNVNWKEFAKTRDFGIARAYYGTWKDPSFEYHWKGALDAGVIRGCYLFYRPSQDPNQQVDLVTQAIGGYTTGDFPIILDIENNKYDLPITKSLEPKVQALVDRVKSNTKIMPLIYTNPSVWKDSGFGNFGCRLFIANYGVQTPTVPAAWASQGQSWTLWQWTDKETIPGTNAPAGVDGDYFNGTRVQLESWLASLAPDLPEPPDPNAALKAEIRGELDAIADYVAAKVSHVKQLVGGIK
jgi:lysozyme